MQRLYRNEPRIYGVATAIVTGNADPDRKARVRVRYPWLGEEHESGWARLAVPSAGDGRGWYVLPEVGDEVIVAFEEGDPDRPVVIGSVWAGPDALPCEPGEENSVKWIQSRSGWKILWDDREGSELFAIRDRDDRRRIEIDLEAGRLRIIADEGDIGIAAPRGEVSITCRDLSIACTGDGSARIDGGLDLTVRKDIATESGGNIQVSADGRLSQSGQTVQARGSAAASLRGGQVEIRAEGTLRQKAPLIEIN